MGNAQYLAMQERAEEAEAEHQRAEAAFRSTQHSLLQKCRALKSEVEKTTAHLLKNTELKDKIMTQEE